MIVEAVQGAGWAGLADQFAALHRAIAERSLQAAPPPVAAVSEAGPGSEGSGAQSGTSEAEQAQISALKARDREVRDHEQAHARVGGEYAGDPSYEYEAGPDGRNYAVAGEVPIDSAPVPGDPEATVAKMDVVEAAALAPADPSSQDRRVAAEAAAIRTQALADLAALRREERQAQLDVRA